MKSWALAAIFVSMAAMAACDGGGGGGGDDDGDGGNGGGTTTDTSTSTDTDTGTGTGTGTDTTAAACAAEDVAGNCGDDDQTTLTGCYKCAFEDACKSQVDEFEATAQYQEFITCMQPCTDDACYDACYANFPTESEAYDKLGSCVLCDTCRTACEAETLCQ